MARGKQTCESAEERAAGVITASAGNHTQGVAYHAQRLGLKAKVIMPIGTPLIKVVSTQDYGAEVVLSGETFDEAYEQARVLEAEEGLVFVHPFADPLVIAGQGVIGLELLDDPLGCRAEIVVCPIGGGGLIGGIATCLKETDPAIRVIGVEPASCPSMQAALKQGGPVRLASATSLPDGIAVKQVGQINYEIASRYVDEIVTVGEDEIANAVLMLLEIEKILVEGAGAAPLAAILKHPDMFAGRKVLSIVTGGNIDVNILLDIKHRRFDSLAPFGYVDVSITLETKGHQHILKSIRFVTLAENHLKHLIDRDSRDKNICCFLKRAGKEGDIWTIGEVFKPPLKNRLCS